MSRIVIHRDRTFTFQGIPFSLLNHGPGWGYEVSVGNNLGPTTGEFYESLWAVRDRFPQAFPTADVQDAIDRWRAGDVWRPTVPYR